MLLCAAACLRSGSALLAFFHLSREAAPPPDELSGRPGLAPWQTRVAALREIHDRKGDLFAIRPTRPCSAAPIPRSATGWRAPWRTSPNPAASADLVRLLDDPHSTFRPRPWRLSPSAETAALPSNPETLAKLAGLVFPGICLSRTEGARMESNRVALKTLALAAAGVVGIEALARWGIGQWGLAPLTGTALSRLIDIAWMALIVSGCPQGWAHIGLGRGSPGCPVCAGASSGRRDSALWPHSGGVCCSPRESIRCGSFIRARSHARRTRRCFSWSAVSSARLRKRCFSGA